jgi:hypothetical protein
MTYEEALQEFGLPASVHDRQAIRHVLEEEIFQARAGKSQKEILRTLCVQLFSIGRVEDCLLIWNAKTSSFDSMCGLDVQFLCGAGLEAAKVFLAASTAPEAKKALDYLKECEKSGDFDGWMPEKTLTFHRSYYHLEPPSQRIGP